MTLAELCDALVIGAGVIGLSIARELANRGHEVIVLERHDAFGVETSSRNSEVIHAGIYYPTDSLKATMCVAGKQLLYQYCDDYHIDYERIGKLIVASSKAQFDVLRGYQEQARRNGAGELRWVDKFELSRLEPAVLGEAAIYSPTTGIVDSHGFMQSLLGALESLGGMVAFNSFVDRIEFNGRISLSCADMTLLPNILVNAAGLDAPSLSRQLGGRHQSFYAIGHYYSLSGRSPFNRLVYPIAEEGGLGIHVTLDLSHQVRFGPDVRWQNLPDYGFDDAYRDRFIGAIQKYYPDLDASRLQPGYTGIRPKLAPAGQPAADFTVNGPEETGIPGYVELLGIESPGLTASLALAKYAVQQLAL